MLNKKPISEKQLAANRANAQRSTGPITAEGRQTVSLNALKHGFTGQTAVLPTEDHATHEAFCTELIDELAPATAMEFNLAQSIANDLWRLNRAVAIETNMLAVGMAEDDPDPDHDPAMQIALAGARTFMNHATKFGLLTLYEQRIQDERRQGDQAQPEADTVTRSVANNQTQAEPTPPQSHPDKEAAAAPRPIAVSELPAESTSDGFVYANDISERPFNGLTLVDAA